MLQSKPLHHVTLALLLATWFTRDSTAANIKIACVQMQVSSNIDTNTSRIIAFLETEAAQGTRVAVFPECAISGYDGKLVPNIPHTSIDTAVDRITAACRQHHIYAIVGTTWLDDAVRRNVALVIGPDGEILCRYAKTHVVESYNRNGDQLAWFTIDGEPATLFICHDERYPELMRIPVLAGAKIGFYISFESEASSGKNFNYRCQIVGRAVENQTWVVSCNAPARNECGESHGQSRIIAPDGTIRQEASDAEMVIRETVDTSLSSNEWVRAGLHASPLDQFWQEGLRVLHSQHSRAFAETVPEPRLLPDRGRAVESPNARLRIACVQPVVTGGIAATADKLADLITLQATQRARVVVFPECALSGADAANLATLNQTAVDAALRRVGEACRRNNVYCVLGCAFPGQSTRYNGAFVIDPTSAVIERYAQIHIDRPGVFSGGDRLVMFKIDGVHATVLIGHDIHFPELTRIAALGGAKIVIALGYDRPTSRPETTESMVVCRSVENQIFTVWCNAGLGNDDGLSSGHSRIVSPTGKVLAEATDNPNASILATIDTTQASCNYPRAGAATPSLAAFWQEGLDVLWLQNPWLAEEAARTTTRSTSHPSR
jgi:predicted amidohydrolase